MRGILLTVTTLKEILAEMRNATPEDLALVEEAYEYAKTAHEGVKRYSGEPYFTHPAAVAHILASMEMDAPTIAAGLLHDTVEDAKVDLDDFKKRFGEEVFFLVDGVTKLGHHKYHGAERHAESLRRLLVATASDVRVLIVKLADRYHNMTTIAHVPAHKQKRIALETLEIFSPIADRLGMGRMKRDLEDLAFAVIDPDAHQHAVEVRKLKTKETEAGLIKVQRELQKNLARKGLRNFRTELRMKGLWSLHQKLKRKGDDIDEIHDIAALRIILETVDDCYAALGAVHALFKPLPGEFKDYIAFPKPNGYQSLHTTVLTSEAGIVEIQVRTEEMHRHAQFGIASHMSYKQLGKVAPKGAFEMLSFSWVRGLLPTLMNLSQKPKGTAKTATGNGKKEEVPGWLTELADAHASIAGSSEFVEGLKEDFFSHRIFLFTPRGDVIDLPVGSTPVDFAYAIHSDLGNHMQGAKVNGKLVSFDTPLRNGQVVEIIRKESAKPTMKWLEFAKTSMARKHIRSVLEVSERGTASAPVKVDTRTLRKQRTAGSKKKSGR